MENLKRKKSGGRQKGSLNLSTDRQRKRVMAMSNLFEENIEEDIKNLPPIERIKTWLALQQYLLPKLHSKNTDNDEDKEPVKIELTQKIVYRALSEEEIETGSWKED